MVLTRALARRSPKGWAFGPSSPAISFGWCALRSTWREPFVWRGVRYPDDARHMTTKFQRASMARGLAAMVFLFPHDQDIYLLSRSYLLSESSEKNCPCHCTATVLPADLLRSVAVAVIVAEAMPAANPGWHGLFSTFELLLSLVVHRDLGVLFLGEGGTGGEEGPRLLACLPTARFPSYEKR